MYAPDIMLKVQVDENDRRLEAAFLEDRNGRGAMVALHGERAEMVVRIVNTGGGDIGEIWMLHDEESILWLGHDDDEANDQDEAGKS